MNKNKSSVVRAKIARIIYSKDAFAVFTLSSGETCVGVHALGDINKYVDEDAIVTGLCVENKKTRAWQLEIQNIEIVGGDTIYFFLTKVISGVGEKLARHIIDSLGGADKIENMIENHPEELIHIKGVGKVLVKKIRESWFKHVSLRRISEIMLPLGFTINQVNRTYQHYYEDVEKIADMISKNIYVLCSVKGFGFALIDNIALQSKLVDIDSSHRVASAIMHTLKVLGSQSGHSAINRHVLYPALDNLLIRNAPNGNNRECFRYDDVINQMVRNKLVVDLGNDVLASAVLYKAETFILEFFNKRKSEVTFPVLVDDKLDKFIEDAQKRCGFRFDDSQIRAVKAINRRKIMGLVGYAGTGKTSISKAILELLSCYFSRDDICVCALSGIATDRIKELSGFDGATIQSILVKAKNNPNKEFLDCKVLVIDESSMIDSLTFYKLLKLVGPDARIVLCGDTAQLPALAAGAIFIDAVNFDLFPTFELTTIHRQSPNSIIALHADKIRKGQVPDFSSRYDDFCFTQMDVQNTCNSRDARGDNNQRICDHIVKAFAQKAEYLDSAFNRGDYKDFLYSHQVIVPMKKGVLGVDNINRCLQETLNPKGTSGEIAVSRFGVDVFFRYKDKVLHTRNQDMDTMTIDEFKDNPKREVKDRRRIFNGYLGAVVKIDIEEKLLWVYFCSENAIVRYTETDIKDMLTHGNAMTIHKAQGSDFNQILLPMTSSHYNMHNSHLLYTAITRASKLCYVVGESRSFINACKTHKSLERNTVLKSLMTF